jgi:DNA polymerase III delta subunit
MKAWDEFVQSNAHKKDLKITRDTKDLLVELCNNSF